MILIHTMILRTTVLWVLLWAISPGVACAQADKPVSIEVTAPRTTLREGETVQLKVIATFADGSTKNVTATSTGTKYLASSSGKVVTVDANGLVTAVSTEGGIDRAELVFVLYQSVSDLIWLTVVKRDALYMTAPKATLRVGETVQVTVQQKLPDGSMRDLTDPSTGTTYRTTSESKLIPEPDGRVTCVGTRGRPEESAIITAQNGSLYGSISFELLPPGPGPSLEVVADKAVLHEGEQTQLHVYKSLPDGGRRDVTATATGTRYLMFPGLGKHDPSVVSISETGLASAIKSIGGYNWLNVIVFVRNGDKVGWIELKVFPKGR